MSNKTRKHIWPVPLVVSIAIIGALAAFLVLANNPGAIMAQDGDPCAGMTDEERADFLLDGGTCGDPAPPPPIEPEEPEMPAGPHATAPTDYALQALDNGARLDWDAPYTVAAGAEVVGYRIHRDAWNADPMHPINMYGDAAFNHISRGGSDTDYSDLGLSYETVYSYQVQAIVEYDVEHWWNNLDCVMMNDVVRPGSDEPQVGPDTAGTAPYCVMYDDLSTAAKAVVQRAYDRYDEMYPTKMSYYRYALGELSMMRTIETADSGGRLQALLDAPTAVRNLELSTSCEDSIVVRWSEPMEFGTVPAVDDNGVYVGPDYIGGRRAGKEEVGEDATGVTYHVQRMVNDGSWADVTSSGMSYTDRNVAYSSTYKYRVRSMNVAGLYSPWTMISETLTPGAVPNVPQSPDADLHADDPSKVLFTWDPPPGNWRSVDDIDDSYMSKSMAYHVERRLEGTTQWERLTDTPQKHMYLSRVTKNESIRNIQTQGFEDENIGTSGSYKYRVAAIIDGNECQSSLWAVTAREVVVSLDLGTPAGLSLSSGSVPGSAILRWTPAANATMHWIAGIKQSDWDANDFSNVIWTRADSNSSHTVTGLTAGAEYVFTVSGGRGSGVSEEWSGWTPLTRITPN